MRAIATLLVLFIALGAAAQTDEFGRASGGSISAITKAPRQLSGSLSLGLSGAGTGYGGTLGGEILKDRLWFFAGASVLPGMQLAQVTAQPVDWTTVTASFTQMPLQQQPMSDLTLPSSFLSLRSTSVLSDQMTLDFRFSRTTR